MNEAPLRAGLHDEELERQLAVLDALELRQAERRAESGDDPDSPEALRHEVLRKKVWPDEIPQPPELDEGGSLVAYLAWIDVASGILARRIETNRVEHLTLSSHWAHVLRNLDRLQPPEVAAVVEGQARARERIAADQAMELLLAAERERISRTAARGDVVAELRSILEGLHPPFEDVPGRSLGSLIVERLGGAAAGPGLELTWAGPDVSDAAVRAALVWLLEEVAAQAAGRCEAHIRAAGDEVVARVAAPIPGAGAEARAPWVERCRARGRLASGTVTVTSRGGRSVLEARFGVS